MVDKEGVAVASRRFSPEKGRGQPVTSIVKAVVESNAVKLGDKV